MRIHGSAFVNQFSGLEEDDGLKRRRDEEQEEEAEQEAEDSCGDDHLQIKKNEQMYDLRPNRRRTWRFADLDYSFTAVNGEFCSSKFPVFKNYQACVECGEEFSYWKSLIRHMECHFDDNKVGEEDEDDDGEQSQSNVKEEEEEVGVFMLASSGESCLGQDLKKLVVPKKMTKYECKPCKKTFSSFQALGGHRASHNKVKGCSAKQDGEL